MGSYGQEAGQASFAVLVTFTRLTSSSSFTAEQVILNTSAWKSDALAMTDSSFVTIVVQTPLS